MAWQVPIRIGDAEYPVTFDTEQEPSKEDIAHAANQLAAQQPSPSAAGAFGRSALRGVAPAFGGGEVGALAGRGIGAAIGGALEGGETGSVLGPWGSLAGAIIGGGLGMLGASKLQSAAADYLDPSASNPFSTASEHADVGAHPWASDFGGLSIYKANPFKLLNALDSTVTTEGRTLLRKGFGLQNEIHQGLEDAAKEIQANAPQGASEEVMKAYRDLAANRLEAVRNSIVAKDPAAYKAFEDTLGVGGNVGIGAGLGAIQGEDLPGILKGAATGALFNDSWFGHGGEKKQDAAESLVQANIDNPATSLTAQALQQQIHDTSKPFVAAATFEHQGQIHEAQNHTDAARMAGIDAPADPTARETQEYGFKINHPDGTTEIVPREAARQTAFDAKQTTKGEGPLHSSDISPHWEEMFDTQQEAEESYQKGHVKDAGETREEYWRRVYCQGALKV